MTGGYLSSQSNWSTQNILQNVATGPSSAPDSSGSQTFNSSGAQVGIFGGYSWQIENYVIGLEGDFAWTNTSSSKNFLPGQSVCISYCGSGASSAGDQTSVQLGWNASLRPRFGYLLTPDTLLYGTTGLAIQSVKISQTCAFTLSDPLCEVTAGNPSSTATNKYTTLGYTLGAGLEKIIDEWVIRAEYRYTQYGNINVNSIMSASGGGYTNSSSINSNVRISTQLVNLGIAYKF
jgi:outer membrane immunogenic protein